MNTQQPQHMPITCPVCQSDLRVTRLQCPTCATEVTGNFALAQLAGLREPHASLIEMFLKARGNVKEMERALGLSYPTVRARLEEALSAAGFSREHDRVPEESTVAQERTTILDRLERHEITVAEAVDSLRALKTRRSL